MGYEKKREIASETFVWSPRVDGRSHDIPITTMIADGALDEGVEQTHLYLGLGENKLASRAGLQIMGRAGLNGIATILPFHHLPCTPANIERTLVEAPQAIIEEMNQRAGNESDSPISAVLHSQGGGVLLSAADAPELFSTIGAWSPAGLTPEAFGDTLKQKRRVFYRRLLLQNVLKNDQNPFRYPSNLVVGVETGKQIAGDMMKRRLSDKLDYALGVQGIQAVKALAESDTDIAIFSGENDPLFRVEEYMRSLGTVGLTHLFYSIPGSHSNPLTPVGRQQLEIVTDWVIDSRAAA